MYVESQWGGTIVSDEKGYDMTTETRPNSGQGVDNDYVGHKQEPYQELFDFAKHMLVLSDEPDHRIRQFWKRILSWQVFFFMPDVDNRGIFDEKQHLLSLAASFGVMGLPGNYHNWVNAVPDRIKLFQKVKAWGEEPGLIALLCERAELTVLAEGTSVPETKKYRPVLRMARNTTIRKAISSALLTFLVAARSYRKIEEAQRQYREAITAEITEAEQIILDKNMDTLIVQRLAEVIALIAYTNRWLNRTDDGATPSTPDGAIENLAEQLNLLAGIHERPDAPKYNLANTDDEVVFDPGEPFQSS